MDKLGMKRADVDGDTRLSQVPVGDETVVTVAITRGGQVRVTVTKESSGGYVMSISDIGSEAVQTAKDTCRALGWLSPNLMAAIDEAGTLAVESYDDFYGDDCA